MALHLTPTPNQVEEEAAASRGAPLAEGAVAEAEVRGAAAALSRRVIAAVVASAVEAERAAAEAATEAHARCRSEERCRAAVALATTAIVGVELGRHARGVLRRAAAVLPDAVAARALALRAAQLHVADLHTARLDAWRPLDAASVWRAWNERRVVEQLAGSYGAGCGRVGGRGEGGGGGGRECAACSSSGCDDAGGEAGGAEGGEGVRELAWVLWRLWRLRRQASSLGARLQLRHSLEGGVQHAPAATLVSAHLW